VSALYGGGLHPGTPPRKNAAESMRADAQALR
jgi:hypothetical protein